jgi:transposase-like protein
MKNGKRTLPACPACARPMRIVAESVTAPVVQTYRCSQCDLLFTETLTLPGRPDRAMDLDFSSSPTMH